MVYMNKKVSVVLPVFNGSKRVSKAIESVLEQSYANLELIIVDDCSTDNTMDVLRSYANKDARIKIYENKVNQKLPRTLNNGFSHATGDYLTWTSDDNTYKSNAIEKMVQYLDEHPNIDMVYADFDIVDLDGTFRETRRLYEPDELRFRNVVGACFLYTKKLAVKVGEYDPDLFLAEDYEYWIKAYFKGNLRHMQEVLYNYGLHDDSLSVKKAKQVYHKTFEVKEKHFEELIDRCKTQKDRNRFYWDMLKLLLDENEKESKRKIYYQYDKNFMKQDKRRLFYKNIRDGIRGGVHILKNKLTDVMGK